MWKEEIIELGDVWVGKAVSVNFIYLGKGIYKSSKVSCGCTQAIWQTNNNGPDKLKSIYTPKPVPSHLKLKGAKSYPSTKSIVVTMLEKEFKKDGDVEVEVNVEKVYTLQIKATVYE